MSGKILLLSLLWIETSISKDLKFSKSKYNLLENIKDLAFEVDTATIKKILEKKVTLKKIDNFKVSSYWYEGSRTLNISSKEEIPLDILIKIKEVINSKVDFVLGTSFKKWLKEYELTKTSGSWQTYEDLTGLQDTIEINIKQNRNEVQIVEKKPTGTLRTKYIYEKTNWSKGLYVLMRIEKKVYEGIQNIETKSEVEYKKFDGVYWLPSKVVMRTVQKTKVKNSTEIERKLIDEVRFVNYRINQSEAVKWFSKQK